jgi:hypothetical protein
MSLMSDFRDDVMTTIFDADELASMREFGFADGTGGLRIVCLSVFWRTDILKERSSVANSAAFFEADVVVTFRGCDFTNEPSPNETIYSPRNQQWRIVKVEYVDMGDFYRLYLQNRGG